MSGTGTCLLLLVALLRLGTLAQGLTCDCNIGHDCDNITHTCTPIHDHACATKISKQGDVITGVEKFCPPSFVSCFSGTKSDGFSWFCCDGDDGDHCNSCPDLADLNVTLEGLRDWGFNFSEDCTYPVATTKEVAPTIVMSTGPRTPTPKARPLWLIPVIVLSVVLIFAILLGIFVCYYVATRRCRSVDIESVGNCSSLSLSYGLGPSMSDGSGALPGNRVLQVQTLAVMMKLKDKIAKGGFGYVWRGEWDGKDYAVKVFPSTLYESWEREGKVYKTCMLSHENILRYIAMDKEESTYGVNYWLVFDYHTNGSLASYIKETVLTKNEVLLFLSSIASGLGYLHRSIPTSTDDSKPMLAHRDLKPSNILIKDDMQCCIGDLGLAVTEKDFVEGKEFPDPFVGTKRYMAPEILGGTIRKKNIESYVRADVYSFALIMWEVCRRCQWHGDTHPCEIPYQYVVPSDPTREDMKKAVVMQKLRPPLDAGWKNDEVLSEISMLISECWRDVPHSRLNAMRIRANLQEIMLETKGNAFKSNE